MSASLRSAVPRIGSALGLLLVVLACRIPSPPVPTSTAPPTQSPSPSALEPTPEPALPTETAMAGPIPAELSSLRVAFTEEGQLWLWQAGVRTPIVPLPDGSAVSLSHDGQVVAFLRDGLWAVNVDGTNERLLVSTEEIASLPPTDPGVTLERFDWVPGTHRLLFNTQLLLEYGLGFTDDLYLVDAETGEWRALLPPGEGGRFHLSPDGEYVALVTPSQIRLARVDGTGTRILLDYPPVSIPSEFAFYASPVWAPDSQSLMVTIPPEDLYYETISPTRVWRLPIDGAPPELVAEAPAAIGGEEISPDFVRMARMVPVGQDGMNPISELRIFEFASETDALYLTGEIAFESWSPDGERFAFRWMDGLEVGLGELGSDPVLLTEPSPSLWAGFEWIDPAHFLYQVLRDDTVELRLGTIGEASVLLAAAPAAGVISFDFSP